VELVWRTDLLSREELKELTRRSDLRGTVHLLGHFAVLGGTGWLIHLARGSALIVPAMMLHGFVLAALIAPLHECVHGTAFRSRRLNQAVASLCGFLILNPASFYRMFHFTHHRFTSVPDKDPEFAVYAPHSWGSYLLFILGWSEIRRVGRTVVTAVRSLSPKLAWMVEARVLFGCLVALVAAMIFLHTLAPLYYWVIPLLFGTIAIAAMLSAEHTGCPVVPDMLRNTRTTLSNPIVYFLLWNMAYHAEHHAIPSIPFHSLPRAHRMLAGRFENVQRGYLRFHLQILLGVRPHR
jgi:fatty acid desaturase